MLAPIATKGQPIEARYHAEIRVCDKNLFVTVAEADNLELSAWRATAVDFPVND